jgi:hypothetical protein
MSTDKPKNGEVPNRRMRLRKNSPGRGLHRGNNVAQLSRITAAEAKRDRKKALRIRALKNGGVS